MDREFVVDCSVILHAVQHIGFPPFVFFFLFAAEKFTDNIIQLPNGNKNDLRLKKNKKH